MSILRQSAREAMKAAVAACRGRLFGGQETASYSDRVKGSWTTMPISRVLEPNHWRGG